MQYEILIRPDGTIVTDTIDAVGDVCERQIRPLQVRLGTIDDVDYKPEYDEQPAHSQTSINY